MVGNMGRTMLPTGCYTMCAMALNLWSWRNGVQSLQPMLKRQGWCYVHVFPMLGRDGLDGLAWLVSSEPVRDHFKKEVCVA